MRRIVTIIVMVQRPLATVLIGGVQTSTIPTLFVLSALYLLQEKKKEQQK